MLFVTGMLRCGTTLLEKLLASHPDISLLSQPFPFLFFDVKRDFLRGLGRDDRYPLGDLFLEDGYAPADFSRYLAQVRLSPAQLIAMFAAMESYSGQGTRFAPENVRHATERLAPGDFADTLAQLYGALSRRPAARWHGAKETLCEEYVPYLLERGAACAIILRDPRDMLASLNHGRGEAFGGTLKPTLFNLRHWRKSVAFALHLRNQERLVAMRYEDLVAAPVDRLNEVANTLGAPTFNAGMFAGGIPDQDGGQWQGNSSHFAARGLDDSSIGTYRDVLPAEVVRFTEAVCLPEMRALGYRVALAPDEAADVISSYKDPYPNVREHLRDFFARPDRLVEERERIEALDRPGSPYFVFDDVREILRNASAR